MTLERYQPGLASRRARALAIMEKIAEGKSVDEACAHVGIKADTFRGWLERDDFGQIVAAVMSEAAGAARIQIAEALPAMIDRMTKLVLAEGVSPRESMIAFRAVLAMLQQLQPSKFYSPGKAAQDPDQALDEELGDDVDDGEEREPVPAPFQPKFLGPTSVTITEHPQVVVDSRDLPERTAPAPE
jgi:hypothetical protein